MNRTARASRMAPPASARPANRVQRPSFSAHSNSAETCSTLGSWTQAVRTAASARGSAVRVRTVKAWGRGLRSSLARSSARSVVALSSSSAFARGTNLTAAACGWARRRPRRASRRRRVASSVRKHGHVRIGVEPAHGGIEAANERDAAVPGSTGDARSQHGDEARAGLRARRRGRRASAWRWVRSQAFMAARSRGRVGHDEAAAQRDVPPPSCARLDSSCVDRSTRDAAPGGRRGRARGWRGTIRRRGCRWARRPRGWPAGSRWRARCTGAAARRRRA